MNINIQHFKKENCTIFHNGHKLGIIEGFEYNHVMKSTRVELLGRLHTIDGNQISINFSFSDSELNKKLKDLFVNNLLDDYLIVKVENLEFTFYRLALTTGHIEHFENFDIYEQQYEVCDATINKIINVQDNSGMIFNPIDGQWRFL